MHARLSWLVLHCSVETRPQLVVHSTVTNRVLAGRLHHVQAFHPQNHHRKNHPRRSNLRHPKTRSCQKNLSRHLLRVNCCLNIDSPNRSIAHPRPSIFPSIIHQKNLTTTTLSHTHTHKHKRIWALLAPWAGAHQNVKRLDLAEFEYPLIS